MLSSLICKPTASCSALDNPYKPAHGRHISIKENKRHWHLLLCQQRCLQRRRAVSTSGSTAGQAPSPAPRTLLRQASTCLCPTPRARGPSLGEKWGGLCGPRTRLRQDAPCGEQGPAVGMASFCRRAARLLEPPAGAVPLWPRIPSLLLPRRSPEQPEVGQDPFQQAFAGRGTWS